MIKLKRNLLRSAVCFFLTAVLISVPVGAKPSTGAKHAILMDAVSGRILYACSPDERAKIASTTKIMTGLLVAETCDLQAQVSVPKEAAGTEGSSMYLKAGEILTVRELLYGMMLHSGNDAAVTLAMYCAGSVAAFADKMNQKADELELTGTHFCNPHGLDEQDHYSTARDLAKLTAYALENDVFRQVVSTKSAVFGDRVLTNHNKLLWSYNGAIGVKTGYTKSAGRILVSAAERNDRRLIAVTINDPNDWRDHADMLDYGFSQFSDTTLAEPGDILAKLPVISGAESAVDVMIDRRVTVPLAEGEQAELRLNLPAFVYAPVLAGDCIGTAALIVEGVELMQIPIYIRYSVLEGA